MRKLTIFIGGDLVPSESNKNLFISADAETLIGVELKSLLSEGDCRIFNLEVPLTNRIDPILKCGPNLRADEDTVNGIASIGVDALTLANNHILDYGNSGLQSTLKLLETKKIKYFGVGDNLLGAAKPYYIRKNEITVGVYACCEHEFSIASQSTSGANPFDPMESLDHIVKLKGECDYVIVLYHGGKEHYRYPSPYLQKACRKMVEKGADLVVCQHSHCIGCRENYQKGTIIYGQGNFLFDISNNEFWRTSLLLEVSIDEGFSVKEIPLLKEKNCVRIAQGQDAENILADYRHRSGQILQDSFIENEYRNFAISIFNNYLGSLLGGALFLRILNRLCLRKLYQLMYNKRSLLTLKNYIECEAHRELFLNGINNFIYKK